MDKFQEESKKDSRKVTPDGMLENVTEVIS